MTNSIELSHQEIAALFENGKCLTFPWFYNPEVAKYKSQIRQEFQQKCKVKCMVVSKRAALIPNSSKYHYFSNGIMLCQMGTDPLSINRFEELLNKNGFKVKEKILNVAQSSMIAISKYAVEKYSPQDDLYAIPYPSKEEFAQKLFENDNICLSASKYEDINPVHRQDLALFSDGRFIVSDKFSLLTGIHDFKKMSAFWHQYPEYIYLEQEVVSQEYIDYIYQKSVEYEWYITPLEASKKYQSSHPSVQHILSAEEKQFIAELISNNKCISVVSPRQDLSPDWEKYALFADGRLIVDERKPPLWVNYFAKEISTIFPKLTLKIESKPVYLIEEIYKRLINLQKTAREIYLEMMKQKARKLKKMLNIPHHEALELAAKITGWNNWKEITQIDEARARFVISAEKKKKEMLQQSSNKDPVEDEYERYKFVQRKSK